MAITGHEIHRRYDGLGAIQVFEDRDRRFLSFDGDAEQSCILIERPWSPVYQYCQAMLMAYALCERPPQRALLAGLGGGSLVHCLLRIDPTIELDVLEYRAEVIAVAQEYFLLNQAPAHRIHQVDATEFEALPQGYELIFSDLFHDDCMNPAQLSLDYTRRCRQALSRRGILVLNLWLEEKWAYPDAIRALSREFDGQLLGVEVPEGNLVLYLFNDRAPELNPRLLQRQARDLGRRVEAPLQRVASAITRLD
ncbi:spermidine synthase [Aestuariirhabdus litorea]|uniref:Spermidine synthase n=1 Tax=Aestuariirhabdus litorea TaxID=2528527 RepID=A0A3P3VLI9_9GAMM|nr:spermidine synthase [Aestuariirhabdus litorea]RRJ83622.1 spermidine synthase [Aestuariirhabdus litorea]RWW96843.1 spermidine synthase [Endozoicomonadaceae bacterium GTF-13]